MTIIEWWGVHIIFTSLSLLSAYYYSITDILHSGMLLGMKSGHPLRVIYSPSWHHQFPANVHSHLQESPSVSAIIDWNQTLSRHYNSWSVSTTMTFFSMKNLVLRSRCELNSVKVLSLRIVMVMPVLAIQGGLVGIFWSLILLVMRIMQIMMMRMYLCKKSYRNTL